MQQAKTDFSINAILGLNKRIRPKKYQCPYCWVALSNTGQFKGHIRIHTGERPFICDCGKSFTRNEELTRHKRIHTGLRPYACIICNKCFGRKDHLKKHTRTHERNVAAAAAAASAVSGGNGVISPQVQNNNNGGGGGGGGGSNSISSATSSVTSNSSHGSSNTFDVLQPFARNLLQTTQDCALITRGEHKSVTEFVQTSVSNSPLASMPALDLSNYWNAIVLSNMMARSSMNDIN